MKRWLLCVFAAAMAAGVSTTALAVTGTHHDMGTYVGAGYDACYACHGYKETRVAQPNLGNVGAMCYSRCHLGTGGVSGAIPLANSYPEIGTWDNVNNVMNIGTYPTPPSTLTKYTGGHKMVISAMPSPDTAGMVNATAWPYTGTGVTSMECTSCHDVHSNTYAPFLRAQLSDNVTPANAFCHRCHAAGNAANPARWTDMSVVPNGAHPSETLNTVGGWGNAATRTGNNRLGRNITFKDQRNAGGAPAAIGDNGVFRNWSYTGTALNNPANHFNPGGKLGDFQGSGPVGCYTCHATHLPSEAALSQLIVARYRAAGTGYTNPMCVACHGAGNGINPGVSSYYHPVDVENRPVNVADLANAVYTVTTGTFNIIVNMSGAFDNGVSGRVTCMSCHGGADGVAGNALRGVHAGVAGTSILSPLKPNCASCHSTTAAQLGTTPNSHHVYGGGATRGSQYATWGYPATVTYATGVTVNLADGVDCGDCHFFNGTAHNW